MSCACTPILVGVTTPVSEIWLPFKNGQISLSGHGLIVHDHGKNLIDRNWLKKFVQVGIDVTCIHTNFGWCDASGFRDMATRFWLISLHTNTAIALMIYMYMFCLFY